MDAGRPLRRRLVVPISLGSFKGYSKKGIRAKRPEAPCQIDHPTPPPLPPAWVRIDFVACLQSPQIGPAAAFVLKGFWGQICRKSAENRPTKLRPDCLQVPTSTSSDGGLGEKRTFRSKTSCEINLSNDLEASLGPRCGPRRALIFARFWGQVWQKIVDGARHVVDVFRTQRDPDGRIFDMC